MEIKTLDLYDNVKVSDEDLIKILSREVSFYRNLKKVLDSLNKIGWSTDFVPLPMSEKGIYWLDFADDYLKEKHGEKYFDKNYMYFTIFLDKEGKHINLNKNIVVNYSEMDEEMKNKVLNILCKELSGNFEWNGNNDKSIIIYLKFSEKKNLNKLCLLLTNY